MWRPLWSSPSMFWMWHSMVVVSYFYITHNPFGRIGHSQVNWASISKSTIKMSPAWAKLWQLWSCLNSHNAWSGPIDDSCRLRPVLPNDLSQSKSTHYHLYLLLLLYSQILSNFCWTSFLLVFVFPPLWYYAAFLYFRNYYLRDPRERAGLAASAIAVSRTSPQHVSKWFLLEVGGPLG